MDIRIGVAMVRIRALKSFNRIPLLLSVLLRRLYGNRTVLLYSV